VDFVAQLKSSIDIVAVVGRYVRLQKIGGDRYRALCPFHTEKTPSFYVHSARQFYKCFGCGVGGDVLKFVMELDQLSFPEALRQLAEQHGIPMPKRADYLDEDTKLRAAVFQMHEVAQIAFQASLNGAAGSEARGYLARRGVSPAHSDQFGLGYAERSGQTMVRLLERRGFDPEQMEASGLVLKRQDGSGFFDRFRNRLIFPIHNEAGRIIAFAGRALAADDQPKYLNSPETVIYKKSHVLYNLHRAKDSIRKLDRAVLVEGYMDAIGVTMAGTSEVVASCGTALTSQQVRTLKRHSTHVVVNFDPDGAGTNATERSIVGFLEESVHVRVLVLEEGLDPDEFCNKHGGEVYRKKLDSAKSYFYWLADRAQERYDTRTAEGRVAVFQFLMPTIQRLSDKLERLAVANDVAGYLGVDSGAVLESFRKAVSERKEQIPRLPEESLRADEKFLLRLLMASDEARRELIPQLKHLPALDSLGSRRIFASLIALYEGGAPCGFAELDARLEEDDRTLLAVTILADETNEAEVSLDQGRACIETLKSTGLQAQRSALKLRIRDAERSGNLEEAVRLIGELGQIDRAAL